MAGSFRNCKQYCQVYSNKKGEEPGKNIGDCVSEEWAGNTFAPYFVSAMLSRCDWDMTKLKLMEGN